jgi:cytochrome c7-like protein
VSTSWLIAATMTVVCGVAAGLLANELAHVGVHAGYAPAQPIAFSHRLHAGDFKVPCLYCHFGARVSRHAGIPPANVCMNCHGLLQKQTADLEVLKELVEQQHPIEWVKVHNLPDFVYFNHSQHLAAGVECQRCHGHVERMVRIEQQAPLTMGWCLDCHRSQHSDPEKPAANLDCGKCHY